MSEMSVGSFVYRGVTFHITRVKRRNTKTGRFSRANSIKPAAGQQYPQGQGAVRGVMDAYKRWLKKNPGFAFKRAGKKK